MVMGDASGSLPANHGLYTVHVTIPQTPLRCIYEICLQLVVSLALWMLKNTMSRRSIAPGKSFGSRRSGYPKDINLIHRYLVKSPQRAQSSSASGLPDPQGHIPLRRKNASRIYRCRGSIDTGKKRLSMALIL